jgi:hypothetical protein
MGRLTVSRFLTAAMLGAALSGGCYASAPLRVQVQSTAELQDGCVRTTDRVFADAGFERIRTMMGVDMFYTPRTSPTASIALGWGIGAWVNHGESPDSCAVTLEALSADPEPTRQRPFTSQRGEYFDAAVRDMAHRLEVAMGPTR